MTVAATGVLVMRYQRACCSQVVGSTACWGRPVKSGSSTFQGAAARRERLNSTPGFVFTREHLAWLHLAARWGPRGLQLGEQLSWNISRQNDARGQLPSLDLHTHGIGQWCAGLVHRQLGQEQGTVVGLCGGGVSYCEASA
jgi:hypothetical protein